MANIWQRAAALSILPVAERIPVPSYQPGFAPVAAWEKIRIARMYKRVGKRRISWIYKDMDGRSQTLTSAVPGDRAARYDAEHLASTLAVEIQQGVAVARAVPEMIERFALKEDPTYCEDQSEDGKKTRKAMYANLTKFFGRMNPADLTTQHGYQYLEDRAAAGAPLKSNTELSQLRSSATMAFVGAYSGEPVHRHDDESLHH